MIQHPCPFSCIGLAASIILCPVHSLPGTGQRHQMIVRHSEHCPTRIDAVPTSSGTIVTRLGALSSHQQTTSAKKIFFSQLGASSRCGDLSGSTTPMDGSAARMAGESCMGVIVAGGGR